MQNMNYKIKEAKTISLVEIIILHHSTLQILQCSFNEHVYNTTQLWLRLSFTLSNAYRIQHTQQSILKWATRSYFDSTQSKLLNESLNFVRISFPIWPFILDIESLGILFILIHRCSCHFRCESPIFSPSNHPSIYIYLDFNPFDTEIGCETLDKVPFIFSIHSFASFYILYSFVW